MLRNIRLLVCGGRDFNDDIELDRVLKTIHARNVIACIIEGESPGGGADILARGWGNLHRIPVEQYPILQSEIDLLGPGRAPMRRNQRMFDDGKPHMGLAFPGGNGTRDMVSKMISKVPVMVGSSTGPILTGFGYVRPVYSWRLM